MTKLKCWKRAKSGESKNYLRVYRNKKDGDDVVSIRKNPFIKNFYMPERDNGSIGMGIWEGEAPKTLKQAENVINKYMKKHDRC